MVSARDALIVINLLARFDGSSVAVTDSSFAGSSFYADVNGDFMISALDALVVINAMRRTQLAAAAESVAELGFMPSVSPLVDRDDAATRNDLAIGRLF